jgi:N-acyl-D-amino-acid deacylase
MVDLARLVLSAGLLAAVLTGAPIRADDRPVTGKAVPALQSLDRAVLEFMDQLGCSAATVAISRGNQLLYSRGFGWSDEARKTPVSPTALMRIASVTKPFTMAMVRHAIREQKLTLNTRAFDLLAIEPPGGKLADPRLHQITVGQLLEHKGGWDRGQSFDPMFRTREIKDELKIAGPVRPVDVIRYMLARPLQFTPGERTAYSNFGYCVLGRVLEKVMHEPYADCLQLSICQPLRIRDLKVGATAAARRDPREVWYPVADNAFSLEVMDSHGGIIGSAPAVCQFLAAYWLNGEPRQAGGRAEYAFFGSLPGTTAMAHQRPDGYNAVVLLNGRRDRQIEADNETLKKIVDEALDAWRRKR